MPTVDWTPALEALDESTTGMYGPTSFNGYLETHGMDSGRFRTPRHISINDRSDLAPALTDAETMVLRLGRSPGERGTQFVLVRAPSGLSAFFLDEETEFDNPTKSWDMRPSGADIEWLDQARRDILDGYRLLPTFSEASLVNLALSAGIVSDALDLDPDSIGAAPATVSTTFDFEFVPDESIDTVLSHNAGHVEIDAIAVTRRDGQRVLLIIEAKTGATGAVPKHKLAYPVFALSNEAAQFDEVIPVFLRADYDGKAITYDIHQCSPPRTSTGEHCLTALTVTSHRRYHLQVAEESHNDSR
ncbi:DUF6997 domain-containing protein [Halolamina rubra]|uniref:DUF6997 domain-containing protein n=1 Tax=Halolamina rubra TaxID=1380430 RepID=UPI0012ABA54C|nr:hypothetical protein [Halolamina rubra]